jgi:hypothetical protein
MYIFVSVKCLYSNFPKLLTLFAYAARKQHHGEGEGGDPVPGEQDRPQEMAGRLCNHRSVMTSCLCHHR